MFQEAINNYLQSHGYNTINLKAVLFDMDGVLFNSMPNHAESWHKVMLRFGFGLSRDEAYMHEGRTGASTINIISRREPQHVQRHAEKATGHQDHPRGYAGR